MVKPLTVLAVCMLTAVSAQAQSYYPVRLDDPKAVYADALGARGDGVADDTAALQQAIDRVHETVRQGIVFVPPGRYRITNALNVWPAIRLVGYGATRPTLRAGAQHARVSGRGDRELPGVLRGLAPRCARCAWGSDGPAARRPSAGREPRHVLLGDDQHRHRDWRGQRRRGGRARHVRAALLPRAHGVPHGTRHRGRARHRQPHGGRPLRRRPIRHLDQDAFAKLAVHGHRRVLRGPTRSRDPGDRRGAHADSPLVQERPDRDLHRRRLPRRAVGQGRPLRGRHRAGRDHQPRDESSHPDQHGSQRLSRRADLREAAREREGVRRARATRTRCGRSRTACTTPTSTRPA